MIYFDLEKPSATYATVWEVKKNEHGFVKGRVSTSEKNKDGEYVNSNWFATFAKNCSEKAMELKPKDRIIIDKFALKNPSVKKADGTYVNYMDLAIYHFKKVDADGNAEKNGEQSTEPKGTKFPKPKPPIEGFKQTEEDDTKLPFDL